MKNKKNKHKEVVLYEEKKGNIEKMFQFLQQVANYNIDIGVKVQSQQLDQFNKKLRSTETLINNANK